MYQKLLFATDLSKPQHDLCAQAVKIAKHFDSSLYLLHVYDIPTSTQYAAALGFAEFTSPPTEDIKAVLNTLAKEFDIDDAHQIIKTGSAKKIIPQVAKDLAIDMILLGNHYDSTKQHLFSTVTQSVIHESNCDVVILKA